MVRIIVIILFLIVNIDADTIYERNCVNCHIDLPTSLQRMFMNYLLVYGGEQNMKAGLKHYLQYPSKHITVMSNLFIDNYSIKKKTMLSNDEIDEALDIYWNKFKVFNKLE